MELLRSSDLGHDDVSLLKGKWEKGAHRKHKTQKHKNIETTEHKPMSLFWGIRLVVKGGKDVM